MEQGLLDIYSVSRETVRRWVDMYSDILGRYVHDTGADRIGSQGDGRALRKRQREIVVVDETVAGSTMVRSISTREATSARVKARHPARTTWKRPANALKKPTAATTVRSPTATMKNNASRTPGSRITRKPAAATDLCWLWGGVAVGSEDKGRRTRSAGTKRVCLSVLPGVEEAPQKKPRGGQTLTAYFQRHIEADSDIVSDKWPSTPNAARSAGLRVRGQVNHSAGFRNSRTGFHTNDMEAEWSRFKTWYRQKFTHMRLSNATTEQAKRRKLQRHVHEYVYYSNVGRTMADVMLAFVHANGKRYPVAGLK